MGYAITGLRGDLKAKAKAGIAGYFGIPGQMSKADIEEAARWLLQGCKFARGEVDVMVYGPGIYNLLYDTNLELLKQKRTVVNNEPFSHAIIGDMIRNQWFGKGKADIQAYHKMMELKKIHEEIIILVVTAVCLLHLCCAQIHFHLLAD